MKEFLKSNQTLMITSAKNLAYLIPHADTTAAGTGDMTQPGQMSQLLLVVILKTIFKYIRKLQKPEEYQTNTPCRFEMTFLFKCAEDRKLI